MTKLYLITGFLGAGKTTFLKQLIHMFSDRRMHLIINEFGKEGVDGQLLRETGQALEEINSGSIFCSCRLEQFESAIQSALVNQPDIIFVEASGLSDPVRIRQIMSQTEKFADLVYMGCLCLIDAARFHKVYETARVIKKQISVSDCFVINKTDLADAQRIDQIRTILSESRPGALILETSFGVVSREWIEKVSCSEAKIPPSEIQTRDITLRSYTLVLEDSFSTSELEHFVALFLTDTYRVKGFVRLRDERLYYLDCTGGIFSLEPYSGAVEICNELTILSGNGLRAAQSIKEAIQFYTDKNIRFYHNK